MLEDQIQRRLAEAQSLHRAGQYRKAIALLSEIVTDSPDSSARMFASGLLMSIIIHDILRQAPKPGTPEYAEIHKYLRIVLVAYEQADSFDRKAIGQVISLDTILSMLNKMDAGKAIGGSTASGRGPSNGEKRGRSISNFTDSLQTHRTMIDKSQEADNRPKNFPEGSTAIRNNIVWGICAGALVILVIFVYLIYNGGKISLRVNPAADITINRGEAIISHITGASSIKTGFLRAGDYLITIEKPGYQIIQKYIYVAFGRNIYADSILLFLNYGSAIISSIPIEANVYLDGVLIGKTPCILDSISEGQHIIEALMSDYEPYRSDINILMNDTLSIVMKLTQQMPQVDNSGEITAEKWGASEEHFPGPDEFVQYEEAPIQINRVEPHYPESAKKAGIQGTLWVKSLVDKKGIVRDVLVVKSSGANAGFEEAAIEAAKQTVWKPAIANDQPIAIWVTYKIEFILNSLNSNSVKKNHTTSITVPSNKAWTSTGIILI